jgi:carbamoyl-phosphate synthase large subunit
MMSKVLNVLITGVGGNAVGHQILHALRLRGANYRIVCVDATSFAYGLYLVDSRYVVPKAASPDYIPAIFEVIRRESIDVLLPGTEAEIPVLADNRMELKKAGCHLVANPSEAIAIAFDKAKLYEWLAHEGIEVPKSVGVNGWKALVTEFGFPIIAKPSYNSGGSRNVAILGNEREIEAYVANFSGDRNAIIFQEYVGNAESEYTVGVVIGSDGTIIDSIVIRRHLAGLSLGMSRVINSNSYALSTGYSQGFIIRDPEIQNFCESLAQRMQLRGPANFQLRRHKGVIKVFEVHPRFSGTASIRADAGLNEPDIVIRNQIFGERFGRQSYQTDVAAIRALHTILVPMQVLSAVSRLPGPGD